MGNLKQNNFLLQMKSFALTLLATTVLGAVRQTQVIDLTDLT